MAYAAANLKCISSGAIGGPNTWYYASTDAHTDVDATGYFADTGAGTPGLQFGMKVGDIVYVVNTSSSAYTVTVHCVSAVDADGDATISAAVLA